MKAGLYFLIVYTFQISGMEMLWGIALKAQNTDVSFTAIQYLNSHYINCEYKIYLFETMK